MYAQLFGVLLFACQIILNESSVIHENRNSITSITSAPATLPEGYVSFPEDHVAYKIHKEAVTWTQARDLCIAEGAHLAIADTVDKIQRIYSTESEVDDWIAVGIQLSDTANKWVRIDNGLPVTSLPWGPHEPDDTGKCAGIGYSGNSLVNYACDALPGDLYACEISI